ncbi:MAG: hypothetical protein JNM51_16425, partial [Bacteroidia bacterium]|nr:hypothetical protein [Bacteroidia bacterium]
MKKENVIKSKNKFYLIFLLLLFFTKSNAQIIATFSTTTSLPIDLDAGTNYASCASPGTKAFTFSVSGVGTLNTAANQLAEINFRLDASCGGNLNALSCYIKSPSGTCLQVATQLGTTTNFNVAPLNKIDYTFRNNTTCLNKIPDYSAFPSTVPAANDQDSRYGIFSTTGNLATGFNGENPNGIWTLYFSETATTAPCLTSASIVFGDITSTDQTPNGDNCVTAINWNGTPICAATNGKSSSTNMPGWQGPGGSVFGTFQGGTTCDWNAANNNDV